jgi:hypothetical protein
MENYIGTMVDQILDYKNAISRCINFIIDNGKPRQHQDLINKLITELEHTESYETCALLVKAPYIEPNIDLDKFINDVLIIQNYESNCDFCLDVFDDIEVFYGLNCPRDYIKFMRILIDHFQNELDYEDMKILTDLLKAVINDHKQEQIYYKTGINPTGVPYYFFTVST